MNKSINFKNTVPALLIGLAFVGLSFIPKEEFTFSQNTDLTSIKKLRADIDISAGTIHMSSHNSSIAEFKSVYTKKNYKAEVKLDLKNERLRIHQPQMKNVNMKEGDKNDWQIKIPKNLDTDLTLKLGAGEGFIDLSNSKINRMDFEAGAGNFELNLANTPITNLVVNAGVGALIINLSGKHNGNLKASINGGIGEIKLVFPRDAGVRVKINGLGSIKKGGFKKQDGYYINEFYRKAADQIDVSVNGGLGEIDLSLK
jgi:hypothetical protein